MKHTVFSFAGTVRALPLCAAIVISGFALPVCAQQPVAPAAAMQGNAPMPVPTAAQPAAQPAAAPAAMPSTMPTTMPMPGTMQPAAVPAAANAAPAKPEAAQDTNPFSNVKPVDNQALRQELPVLEQRVQQMENQMSAIQQVGAVLPADALGTPGRPHTGAKAPMDDSEMQLEASTFVACVNGQALFRDTDQKPFFVDAKEANQNEAIRRIGGCKH